MLYFLCLKSAFKIRTALNNLYESLINKFNTFNSESTLSSVDGTKINIYNKRSDKGYETINL
jgi:hypothetical protein